ncbi:hypothetical protein BC567DRAFT_85873 [Phyllosticta citribraziliensis]
MAYMVAENHEAFSYIDPHRSRYPSYCIYLVGSLLLRYDRLTAQRPKERRMLLSPHPPPFHDSSTNGFQPTKPPRCPRRRAMHSFLRPAPHQLNRCSPSRLQHQTDTRQGSPRPHPRRPLDPNDPQERENRAPTLTLISARQPTGLRTAAPASTSPDLSRQGA